jgi:hypothetical protein
VLKDHRDRLGPRELRELPAPKVPWAPVGWRAKRVRQELLVQLALLAPKATLVRPGHQRAAS